MEPNETNVNSSAKKNTSVIGLVIVLAILIIGGIILSRQNEGKQMSEISNTAHVTEEEQAIQTQIESESAPLSQSTEVVDLEADLAGTNLDAVLADLNNLDQELAQ